MSKATENVAKGVLYGIVKTVGFFSGAVITSSVGKKFFRLMPGEVALVSLDAFGMSILIWTVLDATSWWFVFWWVFSHPECPYSDVWMCWGSLWSQLDLFIETWVYCNLVFSSKAVWCTGESDNRCLAINVFDDTKRRCSQVQFTALPWPFLFSLLFIAFQSNLLNCIDAFSFFCSTLPVHKRVLDIFVANNTSLVEPQIWRASWQGHRGDIGNGWACCRNSLDCL